MKIRQEIEALIGRRADDKAVLAFLKKHKLKAPKGTTDNDDTAYVSAKALGAELVFSHRVHHRRFWPPKKENRKYVGYLVGAFLEPELAEDVPSTREALLAKTTRPPTTSAIGHEFFTLPAGADSVLSVQWNPKKTAVWKIFLSLARENEIFGESRHPPHAFGARPKDVSEERAGDAVEILPAMFTAWVVLRVGAGERHRESPQLAALRAKKTTPLVFFREACGAKLWTDDVAPSVGEFAYGYAHRVLPLGEAWKRARPGDSPHYVADAVRVFRDATPSPYQVPDSWDAFERLAPWLDARLADWKKGRFQQPPPARLYEDAEVAFAARKVPIEPPKLPEPSPVPATGGDLTGRMTALLGAPSFDIEVKALMKEFRLADGYGKGAAPAHGFEIRFGSPPDWYLSPEQAASLKAKRGKVLTGIHFYADDQTSSVGGKPVTFSGYASPLPFGLSFEDTQAAAVAKLGASVRSDDEEARWNFEDRRCALIVHFGGDGRIVDVQLFIPFSFR
jgi:hypothetical protein